jgi:hypothetical protein
VQKPAQSLQAFQQKVASGEDVQVGLLKPLLIGAGALVLAAAGYFVITTMRANNLEKHQTALADLQLEVSGDLSGNGEPASPQELEKRMRDRLPRLEALAQSAPAGDKALSEGLLATWRLQLGVQGTPAPLRVAQRQIALGQGKEASATLAPLRSAASPDKAWAPLFWSNQLSADQLLGDRTQAWKDLGEYKTLFKGQADPSLDRQLAGV